jgi:L-rhamnose-H+ transport protein
MPPNPFLGVLFHWLGGLASGSFYVPFKGIKKWSWETYWLVGGIFSWIVCPWTLAFLLTNRVVDVLMQQSALTLGWTYFFGVLWGFGGLTYGLTMRYLGLSLGTGVALGYCAAFGTLLPPIFKQFMPAVPVAESIVQIASSTAGRITLAGVAICLLGIAVAASAGLAKEREMAPGAKAKSIAEFSFTKGLVVATFCGVMSACFAFGLTAGSPISEASIAAGTAKLWSGLPKLIVILLGGFTTNFIWCLILNVRNRSAYQYFASHLRPEHAHLAHSNENEKTGTSRHLWLDGMNVPLVRNYFFSALAGTTWYFQFFFYTMGETQMGRFGFASWTLHMASIIIFATMWGWIFHEWKGSGCKAHSLIALGIIMLLASTIVIGWGTYLKVQAGAG